MPPLMTSERLFHNRQPNWKDTHVLGRTREQVAPARPATPEILDSVQVVLTL